MQVPWESDSPLRRWFASKVGLISPLWAKLRRREPASNPSMPAEDPSTRATRRLQQHLKLKEIEAAISVYQKARSSIPDWQPPERVYQELVQGVVNLANWENAVAILQEYLERSRKPDVRIRLKLAQILIRHRSRPARALEVLSVIPPGSLSESLESTRAELVRRAEAMIADGVLEIDEDPR